MLAKFFQHPHDAPHDASCGITDEDLFDEVINVSPRAARAASETNDEEERRIHLQSSSKRRVHLFVSDTHVRLIVFGSR